MTTIPDLSIACPECGAEPFEVCDAQCASNNPEEDN
jgi:hypothetical protein